MSHDADRFAVRVWTVCGAIMGGVVGLFVAPRIQWRLRDVVDPWEFGPAAVFIILGAIAGGLITWKKMQR
jgi:hypothetical protein